MKKRLKIAVEVIALSEPVLTGIGNVVCNFIKQINKLDKVNLYYFYSYHTIKYGKIIDAENFTYRELFFSRFFDKLNDLKNNSDSMIFKFLIKAFRRLFFYFKQIYFKFYLPFSINKNKIDIFLGTSANYFPKFLFSNPVKMSIVFDIVWKYFPETMNFKNKLIMQLFARRNLKKVDLLISISESTKRSVQDDLNIKTKIEVIHLAADKEVFYQASDKEILEVKKRYNIVGNYILSVCTLEPRKNLISLLVAYSKIKGRENYKLVLVGKIGWRKTNFFKYLNQFNIRDNIILTGYVENENLAPLYSGASVFVFPTLYEGFGLPVLEAMQCGCPVIVSNCSSIPEVVGDAGIYISPKNVDEMKDTIQSVIFNKELMDKYSKKGIARARVFSWEDSSKKLLNIFSNYELKS